MDNSILIATLLLAPIVGSLINGLLYKKNSPNLAGTIATIAAGISFASAIMLFFNLSGMPDPKGAPDTLSAKSIVVSFFDWIDVAEIKIPAKFVVDPISVVMILVITGVGTLIHLFSVGYMHHDHGAAKYFCYLNLFLFNMLVLVLGGSLPVMFVGWEGVGLCSYLLIGFWFSDEAKAAAGMKAFVTNRIGDAAFILGMFFLLVTFGTLDFSELIAMAPKGPQWEWANPLTLATLFLFIGATGKSAQIPLYVWLPDAMAGPTPVSALIHAATMVTAGIYMIVRLNPMFMASPLTLNVIACIGAVTALFAATIGITQWDIKKILAYSTVSQLGYMFLACGVGAFGAGMFHLVTHAFFKALMFLGSGAVIHALHEEQDVRFMGGLKKYLPITHMTFVMGWLAIIGIPPFAGFFSKDEILWRAYQNQFIGPVLWGVGFITAMITAFYMTRLMTLTFWGKSRVHKDTHPHEAPMTMAIPLIVLGILSVVGGWLGIPHVISHGLHLPIENIFESWFQASILAKPPIPGDHTAMEMTLMSVSVVGAAISAAIAFNIYKNGPEGAKKYSDLFGPVYEAVKNKYFVDEIYEKAIIGPIIQMSKNIWFYFDVNFIDKTTFVLTDLARGGGSFVRSLQSGNIQHYALYIAIGIVAAMSIILVR